MLWRGLRGAIIGATVTASIAIGGGTFLLFAYQIIVFDIHDRTDRANDLHRT